MDNRTPENPYETPRPASAPLTDLGEMGDSLAEMDVVDNLANREQWKLQVFPHLLRFASSDGQAHVDVARSETTEKTTIHDFLFMKRCLEVKADKKRVFQFSPVDFATLMDWIGPPTQRDLVAALKRRFAWILPVGILFVLTSLPLSGDPDAGIDPLPFDPISCGLGIGLIAIGVVSRFVAHRVLFLMDSLWFLILAGNTMYNIFAGSNWLWMIMVFLQISLVASGVKQYRRFQPVRLSAPDQP